MIHSLRAGLETNTNDPRYLLFMGYPSRKIIDAAVYNSGRKSVVQNSRASEVRQTEIQPCKNRSCKGNTQYFPDDLMIFHLLRPDQSRKLQLVSRHTHTAQGVSQGDAPSTVDVCKKRVKRWLGIRPPTVAPWKPPSQAIASAASLQIRGVPQRQLSQSNVKEKRAALCQLVHADLVNWTEHASFHPSMKHCHHFAIICNKYGQALGKTFHWRNLS